MTAEARERQAHERAVATFFASAKADGPAAVRAAFDRYPVLTDRQMQTRQDRESALEPLEWGDPADPLHRGARPDPQGLYGSPDRRTSQFRTPRPPKPPKAPKVKRPVGRPRGDRAEQAARKRAYNTARYAAKKSVENSTRVKNGNYGETYKMTTELARESFEFWMGYTETPIEEIAELASVSVGMADWIVAGPLAAHRDIEALDAAVKTASADDTPEDIAIRAGVSPSRFRFIYVNDPPTFEQFKRVWAVFADLIDTKARAKMIAYGEAHGVPGFETTTEP